ncbi:hypothetical protein BC939DRAFT_447536 [Gamsiella multidivaricata]|uniref:uncharacterized protein n=1 Tax=Gamsiella multidivaricata TaxID=101098 RepID=UPI00221EA0F1|nr:uncharacterized protein BC939DRAFT_447536 [Gamsiella multidivaricata]KAI7826013.1 hypothetical protein BC939DRAFT_447536 [Gamsiella multidivaricata]
MYIRACVPNTFLYLIFTIPPQEYELLPTAISTTASSGSGQLSPGGTSKTGGPSSGLLVKPFYIRFSTTTLNSFFFRLGNSPRLARFWRVWYGLGVAFGMVAMVAGCALLMYAAIRLIAVAGSAIWTLWPLGSVDVDQNQSHHLGSVRGRQQDVEGSLNRFRKRGLGDNTKAVSNTAAISTDASENEMVFVPVIPGVTLPISHLPYYLIALLISGIFHEAGHAIAAAREKTQVSSTGIFLYILYPGAFVDISSRALAIMSPLQQLRVICAGVWHNAVLFFAAWIFLSSGALQLSFRLIGWKHMDDGISVVDVAQVSPLSEVLKPGSVITRLDDTLLKGDPLNIWSNALLPSAASEYGHVSPAQDSGFCIPNTLLFVKPSDCCLFTPDTQFGHSKDSSLSCFTPFDPSDPSQTPLSDDLGERILAKNGQCLPAFDILANPNPVRCTPRNPTCKDGTTCYRPFIAYRTGSLVRIYYSTPSWMQSKETTDTTGFKPDSIPSRAGEHVVVYQGDPKDIWEAVQVTTMESRWSFLPLWLPNAILLTIRYTMSFSLALSVLNIVPARHLDGHHAFKAFVALLYSIRQSNKATQSLRESLVECLLDNGSTIAGSSSSGLSTAMYPKGSRVVKGMVISTTVLLGAVMIGSLVQMGITFIWK